MELAVTEAVHSCEPELCTFTHFGTCSNRSRGKGNIRLEKGLVDFFALLMYSNYVWPTAQLIHKRGAGLGQETRTNPG